MSNGEKERQAEEGTLDAPRIDVETGMRPQLAKVTSYNSTLSIPESTSRRRRRSRSPDTISLLSVDDFSELRGFSSRQEDAASEGEEEPAGWKSRIVSSWRRNLGLALVVFAQFFGTLMNVTTRMLEDKENGGMHPFQVLFARMSITTTLSMLYMWYAKTPHFPLGAPEVRGILVARGMGGFFGVFGLYWSLQYLPLSDATVLTFLAPMLSCWVCSCLLHDPFTRTEQIGAFISMAGVVFIAQPAALFSPSTSHDASEETSTSSLNYFRLRDTSSATSSPEPTPHQRLAAVCMAMVGVVGATIAYVTIRWIGKRAHPLISVNYFAFWCTVVSTSALLFVPSIPFVLPSTLKQWALLAFIGLSGFVMQYLLTAGLRYERGSRTTNMVYSQMLFALAADFAIWGQVPAWWSWVGSALILGSALVVAVQKGGKEERVEEGDVEAGTGLVGQADGVDGDDGDEGEAKGEEDEGYSTEGGRGR